jgi:hypothetical protein
VQRARGQRADGRHGHDRTNTPGAREEGWLTNPDRTIRRYYKRSAGGGGANPDRTIEKKLQTDVWQQKTIVTNATVAVCNSYL